MHRVFDEAEIRRAERALEQALESPDPTAWVYHYTEDATFAGPGSPAVEGREALTEMARAMNPLSAVSISASRTEGSGNIAYARCRSLEPGVNDYGTGAGLDKARI